MLTKPQNNVNIQVFPCLVADIETDVDIIHLLDEYAAECAIKGLPKHNMNWTMYKTLEDLTFISALKATIDDKLVGFMFVLTSMNMHFSIPVSISESLFVLQEYRKTGIGLKLLRKAEKMAKDKGSPGLLICAPFEGSLYKILPRTGYKETNRVFFKEFSCE